MASVLQIDGRDNVAVALEPLFVGQQVRIAHRTALLVDDIPSKQKFALQNLTVGTQCGVMER